jgi:membrane-associated phospholipid phosphatase
LSALDTSVFRAINAFAKETPFLHAVAAFYADVAGVAFLALLAAAALFHARFLRQDAPRAAAVLTGAPALVVALVGAHFISEAVKRPRPFKALHGVEVLVPRPTDYSFPSDHAVAAGALCFVAALAGPALVRWVSIAGGVLLCFFRIYVGVHYPSDVLAGAVMGVGLAGLSYLAFKRVVEAALTSKVLPAPLRMAHPLAGKADPQD